MTGHQGFSSVFEGMGTRPGFTVVDGSPFGGVAASEGLYEQIMSKHAGDAPTMALIGDTLVLRCEGANTVVPIADMDEAFKASVLEAVNLLNTTNNLGELASSLQDRKATRGMEAHANGIVSALTGQAKPVPNIVVGATGSTLQPNIDALYGVYERMIRDLIARWKQRTEVEELKASIARDSELVEGLEAEAKAIMSWLRNEPDFATWMINNSRIPSRITLTPKTIDRLRNQWHEFVANTPYQADDGGSDRDAIVEGHETDGPG